MSHHGVVRLALRLWPSRMRATCSKSLPQTLRPQTLCLTTRKATHRGASRSVSTLCVLECPRVSCLCICLSASLRLPVAAALCLCPHACARSCSRHLRNIWTRSRHTVGALPRLPGRLWHRVRTYEVACAGWRRAVRNASTIRRLMVCTQTARHATD